MAEVSRKEFEKLKDKVEKITKPKEPRKLTEYQKFISTEIKKIKKTSPNINHNEAFKKAIEKWNEKKH